MGKGDRKTAKGKRYNASYGNSRKHTAATAGVGPSATVKATTKTAAKKVVAKKPAAKAG